MLCISQDNYFVCHLFSAFRIINASHLTSAGALNCKGTMLLNTCKVSSQHIAGQDPSTKSVLSLVVSAPDFTPASQWMFGGNTMFWQSGAGFVTVNLQRTLSTTSGTGSQLALILNHKLQLVKEGFTEKQTVMILAWLSSRKRPFVIRNIQQWLQVLRNYGVKQPLDVMSNHLILLMARADTAHARSTAVVQWMSEHGLAQDAIAAVISQWPLILHTPLETAKAVAAWLGSELGWSDGMISDVLTRHPRLFGLSTVSNLCVKLSWFKSQGLSAAAVSRVFFNTPPLFYTTIARNEKQLAALQAMGLSKSQVSEMLRKLPHLLTRNIAGDNIQAKVRFLSEDMGRTIEELVTCSVFLTYSLINRIGPRWAFHSLYCKGQSFVLGSRLPVKDKHFADSLSSQTLDTECVSRGYDRLRLYNEFRAEWQQGEGIKWDVRKRQGTRKLSAKDGPESSVNTSSKEASP